MLGLERTFTAQDLQVCVCVWVCGCVGVWVCVCVGGCVSLTNNLFPIQYVDPVVARSFAQLAAVAVKKHALESDPLLVSEGAKLKPESPSSL